MRAYDEAIVAAYRANDAAKLSGLVTARELRKVSAIIDVKRSAGVALESTLEELAVTGVERPGPDAMVVLSRERWRYFDRPVEPGRPPGQVFVMAAVLRYEFVRIDGEWKMDQARTLGSEYLEPKGWSPRHAPHGAAEAQK